MTGWPADVAPPRKHTGSIHETNGQGWMIFPGSSKESVSKMDKGNAMRVPARYYLIPVSTQQLTLNENLN